MRNYNFKNNICTFLLLFSVYFLYAQNTGYSFSVSSGNYQPLTNAVSLNNGNAWDNPSFTIPVGFPFQIGTSTYTTIYIVGWSSGSVLSFDDALQGAVNVIAPIGQDLIDRGGYPNNSLSPISYKLTGLPGNRILKIEWKNAGFYSDSSLNDFINFQVWLYEGSNIIEYHYGASSINNPNSFEGQTGLVVVLYPSINYATQQILETGYILTDNPSKPTVVEINQPSDIPANVLNGVIPSGIIYTFTPKQLSIDTESKIDFAIYPNPVVSRLKIQISGQNSNFSLTVFNSLGKKIMSFQNKNVIDVSALAAGIYFLQVQTNTASFVQKFIKL